MRKSIDITPGQRKAILDLVKHYLPNTIAWVYGSRAKWTSSPKSDLDMVVFTTPEQSVRVSDLRDAFDESDLPFEVDLFVWDEVPKVFKDNIVRDRVVLVEEDDMNVDGWQNMKLSEAIRFIDEKPSDDNWLRDQCQAIPWLSPQDIHPDDRHVEAAQRSITAHDLGRSRYKVLKPGQLIMFARGATGKLAQVSKPMAFSQPCIGFEANAEYATNDFLYYLIRYLMDDRKQISHGPDYETVSRETLNHVEVKLPPLPEQHAITDVLGPLDDKIVLNRRMNEVLEAMAQAVFKSWFLYFDPVIDNALATNNPIPEALKRRAIRRKGLKDDQKMPSDDIQGLFPDAFESSDEVGWFPKGWEIAPLHELVDFVSGTPPSFYLADYWDGDIPLYSASDAPRASDVYVVEPRRFMTELGLEESSSKILPVGATIISTRRDIWECAMAGRPMALSWSCHGMVGKEGTSSRFIYYTIKEGVMRISRNAHEPVSGAALCDRLKTMQVVCADVELITAFESHVKTILDQILANGFCSRDLLRLRRMLTSKLISGEMRVSPFASADA